jgi:hypothetical protein
MFDLDLRLRVESELRTGIIYFDRTFRARRESAEGRASPHFFFKKLSTGLSTGQGIALR